MDEKDRIEKIMQTEKMNYSQFALEIGIQNSTLSHILNGRNKPSLDVLKRILNRFRNISSDWLILGIGAMYRIERNSQTLSLFDSIEENSSISDNYEEKNEIKKDINLELNQTKTSINQEEIDDKPKIDRNSINEINFTTKGIKKIIVYYSDNTFEEFITNK